MTNWDRHIERAEELAREYPAAAELLRHYEDAGPRTARADTVSGAVSNGSSACPHCSAPPFLAVLRPAFEGAARFLLCAVCRAEWPINRLLCANCGEEDHQKLPVYNADQFPHIRIDACDTCGTYIKAIDLTRNGLAVPEVDDIASIAFDLWARDQGYTRIRPNLLGL